MKARFFPWLIPFLLLLTWQVAGDQGWISSQLMPTPWTISKTFVGLILSGELLHHMLVSSVRALVGFVIGASIGFSFGILTGVSRVAEIALDTSLQMLRNIPHLASLPLVILWFGVDELAKTFLVALGVLFPVYLNTYHGVRSIDRGLVEMCQVYELSVWQQFWNVVLPGAMPNILVGIRFSLGVMWLTLIVAETIASSSGIGYMAMNAREFMRTDVVLVSILLYAMLGKLADWLTRRLEIVLLPWQIRQMG